MEVTDRSIYASMYVFLEEGKQRTHTDMKQRTQIPGWELKSLWLVALALRSLSPSLEALRAESVPAVVPLSSFSTLRYNLHFLHFLCGSGDGCG